MNKEILQSLSPSVLRGSIDSFLNLKGALPEVVIPDLINFRDASKPGAIETLKEQKDRLLEGRVGSLTINREINLLQGANAVVGCTCLCGAEVSVRLDDLRKAIRGEGRTAAYYPPFDNEEKIVRPCRHLVRAARSQYSSLYARWSSIRNAVHDLHVAGKPYRVKKEWFDKETGFLVFLYDVLSGYEPGKKLLKKGGDGDFMPQDFYWVDKPLSKKKVAWEQEGNRLLAGRFYSTKRDARLRDVPFEWELGEFVETFSQEMRKQFPDTPFRDIRIQWRGQEEIGFTKDNWVLSAKRHPRSSLRKKKDQEPGMNFAGQPCGHKKLWSAIFSLSEKMLDDEPRSVQSAIEEVLLEEFGVCVEKESGTE